MTSKVSVANLIDRIQVRLTVSMATISSCLRRYIKVFDVDMIVDVVSSLIRGFFTYEVTTE
jgi:hypothetical protein